MRNTHVTRVTMPTAGFEHPRFSRLRFATADPAADTPPADPAGTPPADTPPADPAANPAGTPPAGEDPWADPEKARAEIERLRRENGKDRTEAKATAVAEATAELLAKFQAALGLADPDAAAPTADQLADQLATQTAAAEAAQREVAVLRAASTINGLDVTALMDSRAFAESIKEVAPTDAAGVLAAINAAVTANPRLKAVANKSGPDLMGGTGEGTVTAEKFRAMSPAERNALFHSDPETYRKLTGN